jgi:hypothetical protein
MTAPNMAQQSVDFQGRPGPPGEESLASLLVLVDKDGQSACKKDTQ